LFEEETISNRVIRAFYPRSGQTPAKVGSFLNFLSGELAGTL
jgi:hypothetical protein